MFFGEIKEGAFPSFSLLFRLPTRQKLDSTIGSSRPFSAANMCPDRSLKPKLGSGFLTHRFDEILKQVKEVQHEKSHHFGISATGFERKSKKPLFGPALRVGYNSKKRSLLGLALSVFFLEKPHSNSLETMYDLFSWKVAPHSRP
jgi:hypothetical protein